MLRVASEISLCCLWAKLRTSPKVSFTASCLQVSVEFVCAHLSWSETGVRCTSRYSCDSRDDSCDSRVIRVMIRVMIRVIPVQSGCLPRPFFGENMGRWSTVSSLISLHGAEVAGQRRLFACNSFSIFDGFSGRRLQGVATFPCCFSTQAMFDLNGCKAI